MVARCGRCATVVTFLVALAAEANAGPLPRVANEEFKFSAGTLASTIGCEEASGSHPHGFTILLRPEKRGCSSSTPQPYVGLFGDYNVLYAETPAQALSLLCPRSEGPESSELRNLSFPGHVSATCQKNEPDGWIEIFVATQAGSWPDKQTPNIPYINYTAQLHTRPARLAGDLEAFKKILTSVNISER